MGVIFVRYMFERNCVNKFGETSKIPKCCRALWVNDFDKAVLDTRIKESDTVSPVSLFNKNNTASDFHHSSRLCEQLHTQHVDSNTPPLLSLPTSTHCTILSYSSPVTSFHKYSWIQNLSQFCFKFCRSYNEPDRLKDHRGFEISCTLDFEKRWVIALFLLNKFHFRYLFIWASKLQ